MGLIEQVAKAEQESPEMKQLKTILVNIEEEEEAKE